MCSTAGGRSRFSKALVIIQRSGLKQALCFGQLLLCCTALQTQARHPHVLLLLHLS